MNEEFVYKASTPDLTVAEIRKYEGYKPRFAWTEQEEQSEQLQEQPETESIIPFEQPSRTEPTWETPLNVSSVSSSRLIDGIDVGDMWEAVNELSKYFKFRVTSGRRTGATTSNGSRSHHSTGSAIDIVPTGGQTYEDWIRILRENPALSQYLQSKNLGILQETTPEMLARTGGTGPHWHIGPDKSAIEGLTAILQGKQGLKLPIFYKKKKETR